MKDNWHPTPQQEQDMHATLMRIADEMDAERDAAERKAGCMTSCLYVVLIIAGIWLCLAAFRIMAGGLS